MQPWEKQYRCICANGAAAIEATLRRAMGGEVYAWIQRSTATEPGIVWANFNGENPNPALCDFLPPPANFRDWRNVPYADLEYHLNAMLRRHPILAHNA